MPRDVLSRRRGVVAVAASLLLVVGLYGVLPQLPEVRDAVGRLDDGNAAWLLAGLVCEFLSFAGYVVLVHTVFGPGSRVGWRASLQLTFAGVAATRLFAAGGAGGIALTAWGLTHSGLDSTAVRHRLAAFFVLLYSLYMAALVIGGLGLSSGVLPGPDPFGLTVVPALLGLSVIVLALAFVPVPADLERHRDGLLAHDGVAGRGARALATVPATISAGVRGAIELVRSGRPGLLGAGAWWAFDVAALWTSLHAFGTAPPVAVVVIAYFVGMLGNLLPLPGGIGGVEGAMVGVLVGFGVAGAPALLAVLSYRAIAFWLPILPGVLAYVGLRRTVHSWDREELRGTTDVPGGHAPMEARATRRTVTP